MSIDVHAHTSSSRLTGLHVSTATIACLKKQMENFGITHTVLMATYFPFKGSGVHNHDLMSRIADDESFLMFGSLNTMQNLKLGIAQLRELAESGSIIGIKLYPGYQNFDFAGEAIRPVYEIALKYNLPVAFHSGELHHCCPRDKDGNRISRCGKNCHIDQLGHLSHPSQIALAVRQFPEVNFILAHMANPFFDALRKLMEECKNVYTDISGQFISGSCESTDEYKTFIGEEIRKFLSLEHGIERVMFGTDFPIQSHSDSFQLIESLGLYGDEKKKIFRTNAIRLLKLE